MTMVMPGGSGARLHSRARRERLPRRARRFSSDLAGHHMDVARADRLGIGDRLVDRRARLRLPAGQRRQAEIAGRDVAGPRVDAGDRQAGLGERRRSSSAGVS